VEFHIRELTLERDTFVNVSRWEFFMRFTFVGDAAANNIQFCGGLFRLLLLIVRVRDVELLIDSE